MPRPLRRAGGHSIDFFEGGLADGGKLPAGLLEAGEEPAGDDAAHGLDGGLVDDDVAEFVVDFEEFEEGASAEVAGFEAGLAADGGVDLGLALEESSHLGGDGGGDGHVAFAAIAQDADEPLGDDELEGVSEEVGLDTQVEEAEDA